ncbi:MAG TPA: (Fe-S)-binding protein, partial [bacterium]|nr:(Fe-S)-binding protein [bacterium]
PSGDLTTSPRRRIVIRREIARLRQGDAFEKRMACELDRAYQYAAIDTCATDGLCSTACPVDIDTGKLMKYFRSTKHTDREKLLADWCADHFGLITHGLRFVLTAAEQIRNAAGGERWDRWLAGIRKATDGFLPGWNRYMPGGAFSGIPETSGSAADSDVIFFPSCLSRTMGNLPGEVHSLSTSEAFFAVLDRAGIPYRLPGNLNKLCCGTPWSSKGFPDTFRKMAERMTAALWTATDQGRIPVVTDTSPCSYTMLHYDEILTGESLRRWRALQIYDIIEYLHDAILPKLTLRQIPGIVVCHPTCSTVKMEQSAMLLSIAQQCSEQAVIPQNHGCCGFAGDRGLLYPELTESATRMQAEEIRALRGNIKGYYSTSRTCEVGMSSATDRPYSSIIYLVERASRPV